MKSVSKSLIELAINDSESSNELTNLINDESVVIIKEYLCKNQIAEIIEYLNNLIRDSIPAYQEITHGSKNFYRTNFEDQRSFVKGHFHQVNFFPWNQDDLNFYSLFKDIFYLKNALNSLKKNKFLDGNDKNFIPKLSFQFYDSGAGFLERHSDTVGEHQSIVPILSMSLKGKDFLSGGLEVEIDGDWQIIDDHVEPGDLILMNADLPHGVKKIDPDQDFNVNSSGRWMGLFAINKVAGSTKVPDSKPLNEK